MSIQLLRPEVSSRIAAGEVIERPASAVKELVENALDAGASRIQIEIRSGGTEYIRVTDDGGGIPTNQVELAFQRFATSKLSDSEDLEAISTLGFRGEALPSIASVSRVEMRTRAHDHDSGARIEIEDSETLSLSSAGLPVGTTIVVRNLFRNFPVRRKFLRSPASEHTRIQTVVSHYAMAYPEVAFELRADRGRPFSTPGSGDLRDAVSSVHGRRVAEAMLEVSSDGEIAEPSVAGLIGPPTLDRANRTYISLFVNRRWVQNRSISYAIEQSYHGFMAERRYPVAVLNVSVPYDDVDVNSHPAKAEIRFKRENRVFGTVQRAVRKTLTDHAPVPEISHRAVSRPDTPTYPQSTQTYNPAAFWPTAPFSPSRESHVGPGSSPQPRHTADLGNFLAPHDPSESAPPPSITPGKALPVLRVLGQIRSTYVIAEGPDGMYMIDQHAAHERIMFEKVRAQAAAGTPEIQSLLEPTVVELDARKMELILTQSDAISGMGFVLEPFGDSFVILRGVPALLKDSDQAAALVDVLDLMADGGGFETWEERAAYSIACHGAIRAGKVLSPEEMRELVTQLEQCAQPNTCPHGRPTMIHMSSSQLEREFGRT
jgi:DNA mismatch repair protein MutL